MEVIKTERLEQQKDSRASSSVLKVRPHFISTPGKMANSFGKLSEAVGVSAPFLTGDGDEEEERDDNQDEGEAKDGDEVDEVESDGSYDTDLETETREITPFDAFGKRTYGRSCRKMKINPVGAVQKGLTTPEIRVKGRGIDHRDSLAICAALLTNEKVKSLILDENQLGWLGAGYIALMLTENEVIQTLSLSNTNLGSEGCRAMMEMLLENSTVTSVDLSCNRLVDSDVEFIAKIIKDNRNVTYLNLSHNSISDKGAKFLQPAIADNETLRTLDLSWNKIRPRGGAAIAEGLAENVVMSTLSLAYNGLCISGARAMGECLQLNEILTDLDLTCNRMFDEGVAFIAKALHTNETVQKLRISNNCMTTASVITMLTSLQENPDSSLGLLDMSSMHIYKDALSLADEITYSNPSFKFLYAGVVNSNDQNAGLDHMISAKHPMMILREFMNANNLRTMDFFKQLDRDNSGAISREEFVHGLSGLEVQMTNAQVDRLIEVLDADGDGEVSISEFLAGDREYRRKQLRKKQAEIARLRQRRKEQRLARLQAQAQEEELQGREDIPREMLHTIHRMLINSRKR